MSYVLQNKNLFTFNGIIGRANFLINYLLAGIIGTLLAYPMIISAFFNGTAVSGEVVEMVAKAPPFAAVLYILCFPLALYMSFANISKRIADIRGKANDAASYAVIFVSLLLVTVAASYEVFIHKTMSVSLLMFVVYIILAAKKGKITSQDYDEDMAKFNWGAFWGTWIWGVNNKAPQTYWAIPAFFTFTLPIAAIIFGIKGNEWAYKGRKWESMEKFHDSQSNQAMLWSIATPALWVVMFFVMTFITALVIGLFASTPDGADKLQGFNTQLQSHAEKMIDKSISRMFDSHKTENGEYKFYINPKSWVKYDVNTKMQMFNAAADFVKISDMYTPKDRALLENEKTPASEVKFIIMSNVKIYSTFNNELLAEFDVEEMKENLKNMSQEKSVSFAHIKQISQFMQKAYKFNDNPTVP